MKKVLLAVLGKREDIGTIGNITGNLGDDTSQIGTIAIGNTGTDVGGTHGQHQQG